MERCVAAFYVPFPYISVSVVEQHVDGVQSGRTRAVLAAAHVQRRVAVSISMMDAEKRQLVSVLAYYFSQHCGVRVTSACACYHQRVTLCVNLLKNAILPGDDGGVYFDCDSNALHDVSGEQRSVRAAECC